MSAHTHVHCSHQHWPSLILILGRRPKQGFVRFVCLCVSAYMSINCGANSIFRCEQIECVWVWEPNLYDCSAATKFAQKRIRKILWCTRSISEYQLIVTILCYEIIYWFSRPMVDGTKSLPSYTNYRIHWMARVRFESGHLFIKVSLACVLGPMHKAIEHHRQQIGHIYFGVQKV